MQTFKLDDNYQIVCEFQSTRSGFRHVAILLSGGNEVFRTKVTYQNRTWESYEFQTVMRKLVDSYFQGASKEKYANLIDNNFRIDEEKKVNERFGTVAGIAMMGEIFGNTKKEKNDWKARMLKAGLPGLDIPEDWDTLSEDEKEKRLNNVIKFARGRK